MNDDERQQYATHSPTYLPRVCVLPRTYYSAQYPNNDQMIRIILIIRSRDGRC